MNESSIPGPPAPSDRRRQRRWLLGLPVRLQMDGVPGARTVELRDVSFGGCFVRLDAGAGTGLLEQEIAIGFVLPTREVALARGRVRREEPGHGFAVAFEATNPPFDRFVASLLEA
jgi:hypothetical protein